jgi:hypothetical protein
VCGFLGLANYYQQFVPAFAQVVCPLYQLTGKDVPFEWTPPCQDAFEKLRDTLISTPILALPVEGRPYVLYTNASGHAISTVLAQIDKEGQEHIISYAS